MPFGPEKRDLATEVMSQIAKGHDPEKCRICTPQACQPGHGGPWCLACDCPDQDR